MGSYVVTYNVTDGAGNPAVEVPRTVNVITVDTTPPVITLVGATPQIVERGTAYTELGAIATDVTLGDLTGDLVIDASAVDTTTVGSYVVTYNVADGAGNPAVEVPRTVTVNNATSPQGSVSISGPSTMDRGDRTSYTVTLTNTGSSTITGAQLTFSVTPNSLLKDVSPGSSVTVGNVAPGGSVSQTWNVRGDNEGSGTITAGASSGGTNLDSVTQGLTVIK